MEVDEMGFTLYVVCDDGDYVSFGKEREVYLNHKEAVATLMFIFDKQESGKQIHVLRFGWNEHYAPLFKNDVSKEYLEYAEEELSLP